MDKPVFKRFTRTQGMALLSIGAALFTLFLKFLAYWLTGSVGLYSDALEALINLAAGILAFVVLSISQRPPDEKHTYGHGKAEYFASGVEGSLILIAAASIVYMAIQRFFHKAVLEHLLFGIGISMAASLVNYVSAFYIARSAVAHDSITLEANAKHLMTDVWTSVGLGIGLFAMYFLPPHWQVLDPIMAIIVAIGIVVTGFDLMKRSVDGFMDAALPNAELRRIETLIKSNMGAAQRFETLRTRKAGAKRFVEFKLLVDGQLRVQEANDECERLKNAIKSAFPNTAVTIHLEPAGGGIPIRSNQRFDQI